VFSRPLRALVAAACGVAAAMASAPAAHASTTCPSRFQVEHNDRIGTLQLPRGSYQVRVDGGLSCAQSTSLFAGFLQDYNGVLPQGWRYEVRGRGRALFTRRNSSLAFAVTFKRKGGGGQRPGRTLNCPNYFEVLHNDAIGELPVPAGRYRLTRLSALSPTCTQVSTLFASFLSDPNGALPAGWILLPEEGAFVQGSLNYGFRIEPLV
jgi:hypothetical protein